MSAILRSLMTEEIANSKFTGYSYERFNLETDIMDLYENYDEIVALEDGLDKLEDIAYGIVRMLTISEESLEEGGLTSSDAELLGICSDILTSPLGVENPVLSKIYFGMEGEKEDSTKSTNENKKGLLRKLWDSIKNGIVAIAKKVANFFKGLFDFAQKALNKNNAMLKDLEGLSGKSVPDNKKTIKFSAAALLGADQSQSDLNNNLSDLSKLTETFIKDKKYSNYIKDAIKKIQNLDMGKMIKEDYSSWGPFKSKIETLMVEYYKIEVVKEYTDIPNSVKVSGEEIKKYGRLPGNKSLYSTKSSNEAKNKKYGYNIGPFKDNNTAKKSEFDVMSQTDLKTILENNGKLISIIVDNKKDIEYRQQLKDDIIKAGDNLDKLSSGVLELNGRDFYNSMVSMLKRLSVMADSPTNQLSALSMKTAAAVMSLCGSMIKAYKGKTSDNKEAEPQTS